MQTKKFFIRKFIFTFLSAFLVFSLSGCTTNETGKNQETNDNVKQVSTNAPKSQPTTEPKPTILGKGDKAKLGDFKIKLKSVKIKSSIPNGKFYTFKPDKGNKFVVISLSVENTGKKANTFLPTVGFANKSIVAKIIYDGDYEFNSTKLLSYSKDFHNKSLNPLESKTGIIAFSLSKKVTTSGKKSLMLQLSLGDEKINYNLK